VGIRIGGGTATMGYEGDESARFPAMSGVSVMPTLDQTAAERELLQAEQRWKNAMGAWDRVADATHWNIPAISIGLGKLNVLQIAPGPANAVYDTSLNVGVAETHLNPVFEETDLGNVVLAPPAVKIKMEPVDTSTQPFDLQMPELEPYEPEMAPPA